MRTSLLLAVAELAEGVDDDTEDYVQRYDVDDHVERDVRYRTPGVQVVATDLCQGLGDASTVPESFVDDVEEAVGESIAGRILLGAHVIEKLSSEEEGVNENDEHSKDEGEHELVDVQYDGADYEGGGLRDVDH